MREMFVKDCRDFKEFTRVGYQYSKVEQKEDFMVWEMTKDNKVLGYELWLFKKFKNPDGTIVWRKPSDEDFGRYGFFVHTKEQAFRKALELFPDRYTIKWGKIWPTDSSFVD